MPIIQGGPRIVFITGGSGARFLARRIAPYSTGTTHLINVSDSGGSTRQLRLLFDMPAIGDLRSRLIDLADRDAPGYEQTSDLLYHRLAKDATPQELERELDSIIDESHPLVREIYNVSGDHKDFSNFANLITTHIRDFNSARFELEPEKGPFDLRQASVGNLFLTGAYLHYRKKLETAIYLYKMLARVQGDVVPATLENIHLAARLANDETIVGQHLITNKTSRSPIRELFYLDREDLVRGKVVSPRINPRAKAALKEAEMIVFSMGSFYTSILSTLHIMGMAEAIRESQAVKIFIANPVEDVETRGMTTEDMAHGILATLRTHDPKPSRESVDYLNVIITGNNPVASNIGRLKSTMQVVQSPLLDSGYYDPTKLATNLVLLHY